MESGEEPKAEQPQPEQDQQTLEEFERRPSTMPDIGIDLHNFASAEHANAVGQEVLSALHALGKVLNLERLAQVIVAYNYDEILAGLDRGTQVSGPLEATDDGIAVGIAMTPKVLRDGEPRAVMVLNAAYMDVLTERQSPKTESMRERILNTLAHECGHVHDQHVQASTLPGVILKVQLPFRDGVLCSMAFGCWEEYIACFLSAFMGKDWTLKDFEETFCKSVARARERADASIRQYRMHKDVGRLTNEVGEEYKRVMMYASYLLGHIDGLNRAVEEAAPKAVEYLETHSYFKPFFRRLHSELRALHQSYGAWTGIDVFEPLKRLADELLKVGGVEIQARPDGSAYVSVPFTPETIPTIDEQRAFLASKGKTA
jgi:hypothetical protein